MSGLHLVAGERAINGLEKLEKAGLSTPQFKQRYLNAISELSRSIQSKSATIDEADDAKREQLWNEIEEITLTLEELNKVADSVCAVMRGSSANLPEPTNRAWAIYYNCFKGKIEEQELMHFSFGLRVGYAFGLMYGHGEDQSDEGQWS